MQGSYLLMCLGGCQTPWQRSSSPLWGGGERKKKYIYIYRQGSPPRPLSTAASSLCLHGHVGLLFCAGLLGDGGGPARGLRRRGRSPHALLLLLLPGRGGRGPGGVEGPVLGQRRGRGRRGSRHGGHGATAVEAFGSLEAGEHGEGVGEVGRRGRRVGRSAHLWERRHGVRGVPTFCLPPGRGTRPLCPPAEACEAPRPVLCWLCCPSAALFKDFQAHALLTEGPDRIPCAQPSQGSPLLHNPLVPPWACSFLALRAQGSGSAPIPQEAGHAPALLGTCFACSKSPIVPESQTRPQQPVNP